ncbi:sodium/bile acid cotransporter-like [Penaeus chinensis]|uniref:sodium/bile acid cotransporter-like n=1 Tax=Penaeus chinensis TaxID=139456 RepID=UPI001FB6EEAF|nr:sodium/bile acid cotransporter-like [Penaeus chinensis]
MSRFSAMLVTFLLAEAVVPAARAVYLDVSHSGVWKLPEDTPHDLQFALCFNDSDLLPLPHVPPEALLAVTVVPDEAWKLSFVNDTVLFTAEEVFQGVNKSVTFTGYYWGTTELTFYLTRNDLDPDFDQRVLLSEDDLAITIDRKSLTVDTLFIAVGSFFVLINNINMGAQLDLDIIRGVLRRPLGPACGFVSQFLCMPTLTFAMGKLFFSDPLHRLGLFTLGCSPGGTSSNFWTLMFNGDINLSITMTIISTIAAMGMMPLWMFTLGSSLLEENANIHIPFVNLAISLITLTVPVCLGIFLRMKRPAVAEKGKRVIKPFSFFILIFFMVVGTYNSYKVLLMMTWQMVVAGFLVVLCGYTLGAVFARVVCLTGDKVIAISIETALQNPGVAFILLKLSLESPYSDLAAVPIIATLFVSGPPLILVYLCFLLARRCCGCCPPAQGADPTQKAEIGDKEPGEAMKFLPDAEGGTLKGREE